MKLAAAIPTPGDILRSFVVWLRVHPKTRYLLIFSAICTISYFFVNDMAWASTEDRITEHTLSMPLDGITDSDGVPIWRYLDIPMDPGNGPTYIARTIRSTLAGFLWGIYSGVLVIVIGLTEWIVSFEWLTWIAAPFELIANGVSAVLEAWMLIPLGILVSAVWIAIGYLQGRTGAATVEFVMVVLVLGVISTSVVHPLSWMSGSGADVASENGLIRQAADAGAEAGAMTINQDGEAQNLTLSGTVVDVTLRDPMLSMAFGSSLEGDCAEDWNQYAAEDSGLDTEEIRKEVIKCSDEVADANQTDSYIWITTFIIALPTAAGVVGLLAVFLVFLVIQIFWGLYHGVLTLIKSFIAIFPGSARTTWLNSLFFVLVAIALVGVYVFAVTIYVWLIGAIMNNVPPAIARIGALLLGILIIVAACTFWKMKRAGKSLAQALAEKFGKTGLSKEAPPKKPSNFGPTVKSAANTGLRMYHRSRTLRAAKTGATVATAIGTAGTSAAAAKAGAAMASKAGTAMASKAAIAQAGTATAALPPAATQSATASSTPQGELPAGPDTAPHQSAAPNPPPSTSGAAGPNTLAPRQKEQAHHEAVPPAQGKRSVYTAAPSPDETAEQPQRVTNLPAGNYGNNWVHKNGQVHGPMTIRPDGTPVKNIPEENKMSRAFREGDSWVTSRNVKDLNPSSQTITPMRAPNIGEAPREGGNK